ncbi:MAG: permease-like cell division protein FtsX [Thermodesulfobacteriota bacterium]|nr:permease-like cell division protein FtsX [Thermodesulfobacteriota bacterium]
MFYYFKRAVLDMLSNRFLNIITIVTIALSILVVSTFVLFFENANQMIDSWNKGIRIFAYLENDFNQSALLGLKNEILTLQPIKKIRFVSKQEALELLKKDMNTRKAFLDSLKGNPLPDALEIELKSSVRKWDEIESIAERIREIALVEDVEYGEKWLGRFINVFNLFRITGYAMSSLFFMIALFITANTVRLSLYSRREEVEIMRLVGATDRFIVTPFYIEGFLQGTIGGITGLSLLFVSYLALSSGLEANSVLGLFFDINFLSLEYSIIIILFSAFLGWLGCYLSLKQFLRY